LLVPALLAEMPWLEVFCPGCRTSRVVDLRSLDRHPLASVGTPVLGLRRSRALEVQNPDTDGHPCETIRRAQ
jgi:hypothetical protein